MKKILNNTYGDQLLTLILGTAAFFVCNSFIRDAKITLYIISLSICFVADLFCHIYFGEYEQLSGYLVIWATIIALMINVVPIAIIAIIITVVIIVLITTFIKKPVTLNGSIYNKIGVIVKRSVLTAIIPLLTYILSILALSK